MGQSMAETFTYNCLRALDKLDLKQNDSYKGMAADSAHSYVNYMEQGIHQIAADNGDLSCDAMKPYGSLVHESYTQIGCGYDRTRHFRIVCLLS